jgi:hypothetical protein
LAEPYPSKKSYTEAKLWKADECCLTPLVLLGGPSAAKELSCLSEWSKQNLSTHAFGLWLDKEFHRAANKVGIMFSQSKEVL